MINKTSIEQLKQTINIVDIISSYIPLKKSSSSYKANCPFHDEKSPSFSVSLAKNIFKCFGCGESGDAISFVMKYDKLPYPQAIKKIASIMNFTLEYDNNHKNNLTSTLQKKINNNLSLNDLVNNHFIYNLNTNQQAMNYLLLRGLTKESIQTFNLGYAPYSKQTLSFIKNNNIDYKVAFDMGILSINEKDNSYYSKFSNRITFPIYSNTNIVGFGARTISDHKIKYLNSPQNELFNKSKLFYGYNLAKEFIYKNNEVIIVEGYLDVIMLHQVGIKNVIATLGTAFTKDHMNILLSNHKNTKIILAFDGDNAGNNAAFKSSLLLSQNNIESYVVLFDDNIDPSDLVKENKVDIINNLLNINNAKSSIQYVLRSICNKYNIIRPYDKKRALDETIEYLNTLLPFYQDEYKQYLANLLNIDVVHINQLLKTKSFNTPSKTKSFNTKDILEISIIKTFIQNHELYTAIVNYLDAKYFKFHQNEFNLIKEMQLKHPTILEISNDKNIFILKDKISLEEEINSLKINYYETEIQYIDNSLSFEDKLQTVALLRKKIESLKNTSNNS